MDHQNPTGYSQTLAELEIVDPATGRPSEAADAAARVARLNTFDPLGPVAQTDFQQTDTGLSKTYRHLFADPLGSIRTLTSQTDSGTIESAAEDYTAFGTPINGSLTSGEPPAATPQYAFTAQTRDPYSGLQYHRARWLNTGIGQWTSSDPEFDFPDNFGSSSAYVGGLPTTNSDPSGSMTLLTTFVVSSIVAILTLSGIENQMSGGAGGFVGGVALGAASMLAVLVACAALIAFFGPAGVIFTVVFLAWLTYKSVQALSQSAGEAWGNGDYGLAVVRLGLLGLIIANAALIPGFIKTAWTRAQMKAFARKTGAKIGKFSPVPWRTRMIDALKFRSAKGRTMKGFARNAPEFWRLWLKKFPEMLSDANKARINGHPVRSPRVDSQWLRYYPEHEPWYGDTLQHHHINHGRWAIPLPEGFHQQGGWSRFWHSHHNK